MASNKSRLWLLPSTMSDAPVGDVLPPRNIAVASELRYFIVENVRTARRFLKRCNPAIVIDDLTFFTLNTHTTAAELPAMIAPLDEGHDMGLISEAGCPAIADPGADAVDMARRHGHTIVPMVGPSSIILGLMASGFNGQSFAFNGYLPIDKGARAETLRRLESRIRRERQTQIFIETPYRNNKLIAELATSLPGSLRLAAACDLTGPGADVRVMTLAEWGRANYNYDKRPTIFLLFS